MADSVIKRRLDLKILRQQKETLDQVKAELAKGKVQLLEEFRKELQNYGQLRSNLNESEGNLARLRLALNCVDPTFRVPREGAILWLLGVGVHNRAEIAQILGIPENSVSNFLNTAEKNGNVKRMLLPGKERGALFFLTGKSSPKLQPGLNNELAFAG